MPNTDGKAPGYRKLRALRAEDIIAVHQQAAKVGETWNFEIRDFGSIDYLADRISRLAEARHPPTMIASLALHLLVREHPFWDANHRGGFELAPLILRAFGLRIGASREEVEAFVRSIDTTGIAEGCRKVGQEMDSSASLVEGLEDFFVCFNGLLEFLLEPRLEL
ncbi:MAG TPA: hypothetical protein VF992_06330, partial [Thermoplasmata archaeon]